MSKKVFFFVNIILMTLAMSYAFSCPLPNWAQAADTGLREGNSSETLDKPFQGDTIGDYANAIFKFGILICVLAAAIYISIGAFAYFAAAGNASSAEKGKEIIQRSIIGLVLALVAWIIISKISPQFTELKNPSLP